MFFWWLLQIALFWAGSYVRRNRDFALSSYVEEGMVGGCLMWGLGIIAVPGLYLGYLLPKIERAASMVLRDGISFVRKKAFVIEE